MAGTLGDYVKRVKQVVGDAEVSVSNPVPVSMTGSITVGNVTNAGTFAVQAAQAGTWNITNVSGTVSLPTGASTSAKQPALGVAGTASTDVITVQGIAAMTPILVTLSGTNNVTNAGTFATQATQAGTWNITNVSGTVSLPTGASTAAKQPALGTAGSASADVITIQGIAAMTKLLVTPDLPSGASTAAKQPALGTAGSASADVITVQGVASMTPILASSAATTSGGSTPFRNTALSNTAVALKASGGNLYGVHIENSSAAKSYVHFYDVAQGSVTVGTTTPAISLVIPAQGAYDYNFSTPLTFATAITIAATTTATGGTAPASALLFNAYYK